MKTRTVTVMSNKYLEVTAMQASILLILKTANYSLAIEYAWSLASLTRQQAETLLGNIADRNGGFIVYGSTVTPYNVSHGEYDLIQAMYRFKHNNEDASQKVQAIKFIRSQYGLGLKEAKDLCDTIGNAEL